MAVKRKQQEEESGEGAPLWIISFADMISLLMAFFVMLSTFSSFGPAESAQLKGIVKVALSSNYGWHRRYVATEMGPEVTAPGQTERGSEKPTLEKVSFGNSIAETEPKDFRTHKVFLIESGKVFWFSGVTLSAQGRDFLNTLASFVNKIPSRIVISENGPGNNSELGIFRSIVVVEYLVSKSASKNRFSIAAKGMLPEENFKTKRMLEITLLDESTYK